MKRLIAYGFDFDNTIFNTQRLKEDLPNLLHASFPSIPPEAFSEAYAWYRINNYGRVDMHAILKDIAGKSQVSEEVGEKLLNGWLGSLPYETYVFDGADRLFRMLEVQNIFLVTKSTDREYQQTKIEHSGIPVIHDEKHIHIVRHKNQEVFTEWAQMLHERGFEHIVYSSDESKELRWASIAAKQEEMGFDGIHHQFGEFWRNDMDEVQNELGTQYHPVPSFLDLASTIRGIYMNLEGDAMRPEQAPSGSRGVEFSPV
jgi:hypothetical protein